MVSTCRLWRGIAPQARLLEWRRLAPAYSTLSGGATKPLSLPLEAVVPSPGCPKVAHFAAFDHQAACSSDPDGGALAFTWACETVADEAAPLSALSCSITSFIASMFFFGVSPVS